MILGRLGLVGFFGILIPGIYLGGTLLATLVGGIVTFDGITLDAVFKMYEKVAFMASSAFLLISYFLGVLMRVLGPEPVDRLSTWFLSMRYFRRLRVKAVDEERRKQHPWVFEGFPYPKSIKKQLRKSGMSAVAEFMEKLNPEYAREDNTIFFNYCKLALDGNCTDVAKVAMREEAMVRFLSGSAFALIISAGIWLVSAIRFVVVSPKYAAISAFCSTASILALWPILLKFKFQRHREVLLVWTSIYLLLRGALPNGRQIPPADLLEAFRTTEPQPQTGVPPEDDPQK